MSREFQRCPICQSSQVKRVLEADECPAHCVVLRYSRETALAEPTGRMVLVLCSHCGFAFNSAFDPDLLKYGSDYESTQSHSPTFNAFHQELARRLVENHNLCNRTTVEIGCGQGEFLGLLREAGAGPVIGFDPAYDEARSPLSKKEGITVYPVLFSPDAVCPPPSLIICKMTMEHIADPLMMLQDMRRLAARGKDCRLFIQVPNAEHTFSKGAFWDIYYEHCSYFTLHALEIALRKSGFTMLHARTEFDEQYLLVEAGLTDRTDGVGHWGHQDFRISTVADSGLVLSSIVSWRKELIAAQRRRETVLLWGGGSRAVAFMSFMGRAAASCVAAAVDINPCKAGTFLPGSGLPVISPAAASEFRQAAIVILNPVYADEIRSLCRALGIDASFRSITDFSGPD